MDIVTVASHSVWHLFSISHLMTSFYKLWLIWSVNACWIQNTHSDSWSSNELTLFGNNTRSQNGHCHGRHALGVKTFHWFMCRVLQWCKNIREESRKCLSTEFYMYPALFFEFMLLLLSNIIVGTITFSICIGINVSVYYKPCLQANICISL